MHPNTGPVAYGADYVYKRYPSGGSDLKYVLTINELTTKKVTYLNDEQTPCEDSRKQVDLYECAQVSINGLTCVRTMPL